MKDFSAIVTCKGRLEHLRQTLPLLCELPLREVILVDYGCPDESGKWAAQHCPTVRVIYVNDDTGFNVSRARNIAAETAASEYLFFVDADVKVKPAALAAIDEAVGEYVFVTVDTAGAGNDLRGTCIVNSKKFQKVDGYDELLTNYGMEDVDFTTRLRQAGLSEKKIPAALFEAIPHDNVLRTRYISGGSLQKHVLIATFYQEFAKRFRPMTGVNQLHRDVRADIHAAAVSLVNQLVNAKDPTAGARINMKLPNDMGENKIGGDMIWEFDLTMTMKPKDPVAFKRQFQHVLHYKKS